MQSGGSGGGLSSDINVTPMIDVLLVLLIIFMAVLPSMRKAIDIQLPDPNPSVQPANPNSNQIVLEVKPGGSYAVNTEAVAHDGLPTRLHEIYDSRPEKIIFIKGDPKAKYAEFLEQEHGAPIIEGRFLQPGASIKIRCNAGA